MANLDNFILFDVAEAFIIDKTSKEIFTNKYLTTSGISQTSNETEIRGGRGAALLALIESEKSVEVSLGNSVISRKWLEMQQGAEFQNDQIVNMVVTEKVKLTIDPLDTDPTDGTNLIGVVTNPSTVGVGSITNCEGKYAEVTITGTQFIVPADFGAKEGDEVTVSYKAEVSGADVLEIDAAVFPKGWELQLEVPAMDKCTQKITHKVVFIFDNVRPSSSLDMSFAMGEAIAPEMTVKIMQSCCSTKLGRIAIVPITP